MTHEFPAGRASYRCLHLAWPSAIEHDNEIASAAGFDDTENRGPRVHRSRAVGFAIQHSGEPDRRPRRARRPHRVPGPRPDRVAGPVRVVLADG
jgi:hypothetical protein